MIGRKPPETKEARQARHASLRRLVLELRTAQIKADSEKQYDRLKAIDRARQDAILSRRGILNAHQTTASQLRGQHTLLEATLTDNMNLSKQLRKIIMLKKGLGQPTSEEEALLKSAQGQVAVYKTLLEKKDGKEKAK